MSAMARDIWALRSQLDGAVHEAEQAAERLLEVQRDRDHWVRLFNRLEAAISHHKAGEKFPDDHDERLWAARDRILADAATGGGR